MSEAPEPKDTKGQSKLKQLATSSTWTSPFRSGKKKNIVQEFKTTNDVSQIQVPKKFTSHPTLEAENKKAAAAKTHTESIASADKTKETDVEAVQTGVAAETDAAETTETVEAAETDVPEAVVKDIEVAEENAEVPVEAEVKDKVDAEVEAINEGNHAALVPAPTVKAADPNVELHGAPDDDIVEQVEKAPIELEVENKYEPVQMPNQAVLDSLQDKPNLLNRYQELNTTAIGSVSKSLDDPNKVIDLGSGLKLTQQQLLDIAAKRVAPLISNINEEVAKSREEDRIVNQNELDSKVAKHQSKLKGLFDKHVAKCEKQKEKITKDHELQLGQVANRNTAAVNEHEAYKTQNATDIETANTEYAEREKKAVEKHESDKETLLKNHDELEATKKQELQSAKDDQVTTAQEIEELKEKNINVGAHNEELDKELEELTKQLEDRENELKGLQDKLYAERIAVDKHEATKKDINEKLDAANAEVETKKSHKGKLALEVGALAAAVTAYTSHLANLRSEKEAVPFKISAAKEKHSSWVEEKKEMAVKAAREHEQQRLEAKELAATEEYKTKLEEEKRQLEEERQKHLEEKEQFEVEEKQRLAEEKQRRAEEEEQAAANKRKLEEEEAAKKELAAEKERLDREASEAEKNRKLVEDETRHAKEAASAAAIAGTTASVGKVSNPIALSGPENVSKSVKSPVEEHSKSVASIETKEPQHELNPKSGAFAVGAAAGGIVGGGAAASAALATPEKVLSGKGSLKKKFKSLIGRNKEETQPKSVPVKSEDPEDSDVFSIYEEVDDDEYERNIKDPNYIAVDPSKADELLKRNRDKLNI